MMLSCLHLLVSLLRCRPRTHWFPDNNFSLSEWISMKFLKKVQYHKKKVGIDFWDSGTNLLGIKGPKGAENKHFSTFRIITCV